MHCKLQGILTSHFSGLDPFAGDLCVQLGWRIICQWRSRLTYSLPHLLLCTCYFLGYSCDYYPTPFQKSSSAVVSARFAILRLSEISRISRWSSSFLTPCHTFGLYARTFLFRTCSSSNVGFPEVAKECKS